MERSESERVLQMLRDPNVETLDVATAAGVSREEAGRAARLVLGIANASAEDAATLPGPLAVAVCLAALDASRVDLVAALAAHPAKEVAKEAKRGLHLMKSRGVAVPEPPRPTPAPPRVAPEPALPAYATAVDGRGERAVWIPRTIPGKGVEVAQAVLSDEVGIVDLQIGTLGRKEWRALARGLVEKGAAMGLAELDRGHALGLVAAARPLNDQSGRPVPERTDPFLAQAGPQAAPSDPSEAFPPLPAPEEEDALAASGKLHELPLLDSWIADEGFLREVAAKLDEIAVSPLYVDERQRAEQAAYTLSSAVERYFDERRRAVLARRLFSLAEHLLSRGEPAHARAAAAAARALRGGVPPRAIPFARLLVERAFPDATAAPGDPSEPPGAGAPLIVAPR